MAAPSQVKKFVTGKGVGTTSEITPVILQRWPEVVEVLGTQEDTLMALAMMQMAKCVHDVGQGRSAGWTQFQLELIVKMIDGTKKQKPRLVKL